MQTPESMQGLSQVLPWRPCYGCAHEKVSYTWTQIRRYVPKINLRWLSQYGHWPESIQIHKSKNLVKNTTVASNYIPKGPRICINWNLPFHFSDLSSYDKIFKSCFSAVFYQVNLTWQQSHLGALLLSKFWSERRIFNWFRFWASQESTLMLL